MSKQPFVSVVIPVFNAADMIDELLQSLLVLDYPADHYEIIVVDNGSTDNTRQLVEKYPVILLEERETPGPAAARNKGIRHARGEIIAFTDADCVADRNWLKMLVADHEDLSIGAFAGDVRGCEPAQTVIEAVYNQKRYLSPFRFETPGTGGQKAVLKQRAPIEPRSRLERLWVRLGLVTYYQRRAPLPPMHSAPTANVAYRREVFDQVGLFDISLLRGQDVDFAWQMQLNSNYKFHGAPEAVIYHRHRVTVSELYLQRQRYGLSRILILDKYLGLDANVRRQAILESSLNIVFSLPYTLAMLGYRGLKAAIRGQPYSTYLYEPLVNLLGDVGYNYGRIKTCLAGLPPSGQKAASQDRVRVNMTQPDNPGEVQNVQ